jgi:type I restriction-modification system DNA methylase subunit
MNMILHGIDAPNIIHTNTLTENLSDIQDKNRLEVILANPPFGAGLIYCDERKLEQPEVSVHSHLLAARLIVNSPR